MVNKDASNFSTNLEYHGYYLSFDLSTWGGFVWVFLKQHIYELI